jgi:hypothetical protein
MKNTLPVVLLLVALSAAPASAQSFNFGFVVPDHTATALMVVGGVHLAALAAIDIGLIADSLVQASNGHGAYSRTAVLEIVFGAIHLVPALLAATTALRDDMDPVVFSAIGPVLGIGSYLLFHGIWSLTDGGRPPDVGVTFAPTPGGASLSISGRF